NFPKYASNSTTSPSRYSTLPPSASKAASRAASNRRASRSAWSVSPPAIQWAVGSSPSSHTGHRASTLSTCSGAPTQMFPGTRLSSRKRRPRQDSLCASRAPRLPFSGVLRLRLDALAVPQGRLLVEPPALLIDDECLPRAHRLGQLCRAPPHGVAPHANEGLASIKQIPVIVPCRN